MSRKQSVRAIVINGQSALVMKRNKFGRVYYTLIGGDIEIGETAEHALRRELQEEAGLNVGAIRPVFMENAGDMYGLQYMYLCEYRGGEIQLGPSSIEAQLNTSGQNTYEPMWLPIDQLAQVSFRSSSVRDALLKALKNGFPETPVELEWKPESVTQ